MKVVRQYVFSFLVFAFFSCAFFQTVYAETIITNPIVEDTVWTKEGNPYLIDGSLVVLDGASLAIEEGVEIQIGGGIVVFGSLVMNGVEGDGVVTVTGLSDEEGTPSDFGGLYFIDSEGVYFSHVSMSHFSGGYSQNSAVVFDTVSFSLMNDYFDVSGGSLGFQNTSLTESSGFSVDNTTVTVNDFSVNSITGPIFELFGESVVTIKDSSFKNTQGYSLFAVYDTSSLSVSDSEIQNISGRVLEVYNKSDVSFSGLDIFDVFDQGISIFDEATFLFSHSFLSRINSNAVELFNSSNTTFEDIVLSDGLGDGLSVYQNAVFAASDFTSKDFLGAGLVVYQESSTHVTDSFFKDNTHGILSYAWESSQVHISQSRIVDNVFGIENYTDASVDAVNNWWGDESGPLHTNILDGPSIASENPDGIGDSVAWISGRVEFSPWLLAPPGDPDPVIIIPGIMGSWQKHGEWVIDPILHVYDDLITTLQVNGYVNEKDLFTLPYDWRNSNVDTAVLLKNKIDEVKVVCACDKVDLVAHSMGGLVARQYIQSDTYEQDVDQLIFLGTPHLGSPEAYITWEGGVFYTSKFIDPQTFILGKILEHQAKENGYSSLYEYIHQRPITSLQELLSIENYLFNEDGTLGKVYPDHYPENIFLNTLNSTIDKLYDSGVRITNIIGKEDGDTTVTGIRVGNPDADSSLWQDGEPVNFGNKFTNQGIIRGEGDETVPYTSLSFVDKDIVVLDSEHKQIVEDAEGIVYKKLTGKDAIELIHSNGVIKSFFITQLYSPVDMLLVSPSGKRIGVDSFGNEYNEVENAFYSGNDTVEEFVIVFNPEEGEYSVQTIGTGSGEYTIAMNYFDEDTEMAQSYTGTTEIGVVEDTNFILVTEQESFDENIDDDVGEVKHSVTGSYGAPAISITPVEIVSVDPVDSGPKIEKITNSKKELIPRTTNSFPVEGNQSNPARIDSVSYRKPWFTDVYQRFVAWGRTQMFAYSTIIKQHFSNSLFGRVEIDPKKFLAGTVWGLYK